MGPGEGGLVPSPTLGESQDIPPILEGGASHGATAPRVHEQRDERTAPVGGASSHSLVVGREVGEVPLPHSCGLFYSESDTSSPWKQFAHKMWTELGGPGRQVCGRLL